MKSCSISYFVYNICFISKLSCYTSIVYNISHNYAAKCKYK